MQLIFLPTSLSFLLLFCLAFYRQCFFLVTITNLSWLFLMLSSSCIDASTLSSMRASPSPPSFHDTYSLSLASLECNSLSIVITFLVYWSIYISSSRVHFKNDPDYHTRRTAKMYILLTRFLLLIVVSLSFLVRLRYSLFIFYFIACLMRSAFNIPKYL